MFYGWPVSRAHAGLRDFLNIGESVRQVIVRPVAGPCGLAGGKTTGGIGMRRGGGRPEVVSFRSVNS
jgi:hypothetical protein